MNGDLEKRLSNHIEEGALFQGKVLQWIENFDEKVLPELVTSPECAKRRAERDRNCADGELASAKANKRIWSNRIWSVIIAVALLLLGAWLGARGDEADDAARTVPQGRMELPG